MNHPLLTRRAAVALGAACLAGQTFSQGTARQVSFIVPQPAGNPTDGIARKLQPLLQKDLGQSVLVENIPGAGGSLGVQKALSTGPGVPVLVVASQTEPILTPLTLSSVKYKSEELRPVALVGRAPYLLVGRPDLPAKTLAELVALARQSSGSKPLAHGNIGYGSMIHLLGEQWSRKSGVELTQVPYKGVPPLIQDLMGGQIDLSFLPLGGSIPSMVESGKLRVYGVTSAAPSKRLSNVVPISKQQPELKDFVFGTWAAIFVPRSLPEAAAQKLHEVLAVALEDSDVKAYSTDSGIEVAEQMNLAQLESFYDAETKAHRALVQAIGVKPQ